MTEVLEPLDPRTPKRLNFAPGLVPHVISGQKFLTWRINDDKDLQPGDVLSLWEKGINDRGEQVEASNPFGNATVIEVWEKPFNEFGERELVGHEPFSSLSEMMATYKRYYGESVTEDTVVKVVRFNLD